MMTGSLGDTRAHHYQPGLRFRHRAEAQGFRGGPRNSWRGPCFSRTTSTLAVPAVACVARAWCSDTVLCLTHFSDEACLTDISTQTQGSAVLLQIPPVYAGGRVAQPCRTPPHGRRTLGLGGGRLPGFRHTRTLESQANFGVGKTCQLVDVRARIRIRAHSVRACIHSIA